MYRKKVYRDIKSEFSPSLRKANTPRHNQRKGRILQQTPLKMFNPPTQMMSKPELDKMYRLLEAYKYKFPIPQNISSVIQPFFIQRYQSANSMFPLVDGVRDYRFTNERLTSVAMVILRENFPSIVNRYRWTFQLLMISFVGPNYSIDANKQYFINWHSNLLTDRTYQIFIKSLDIGINSNRLSTPIENRPFSLNPDTGDVIIRAERISIANSGLFTISYNNIQSNDSNPSDNGQYPYMDTGVGDFALYHGELEFVPSTGMEEGEVSTSLQLLLHILCIPHPL